jgi:DNA-binding MarR family transcriptional regulator
MNSQATRANLAPVTELGPTFLGLQAHQLLTVIDSQGTALLAARGIDLPSRAVSTLICLSENRRMSVTGLAQFLGLSHQLVRHRLQDLKARKLVSEDRDPADLRRTLVSLTRRGRDVALRIGRLNSEVEQVYLAIFDEIGTDLFKALVDATRSLLEKSLSERISEMRKPAP